MNNRNQSSLSVHSLIGVAAVLLMVTAQSPSTSRAGAPVTAAAWAHWRGPGGQGYSDDIRVPLTWSDTENLLWKCALPGLGNSSPIVWGDRIFLTASNKDGSERHVLCVRAADGKLLWQRLASKGVETGRTHHLNGYASPSCTTDGTYVYAFFGTPGLFCYDFDGELIWKHSFGLFTTKTGWGIGASPFLFEDLVIQNCDNDGAAGLPPGRKPEEAAPMALVALDKRTGKVRWQTERNQDKGWSTPLLIPAPDGRTELVLNGPLGVWAYDPRTGREIWHCARKSEVREQARFGEPLPVTNRDTMFVASGRPGPLQAIRLSGGDGDRGKVIWQVDRKGSRDVASPLLLGDYLYLGDWQGFLSCLDTKNGQLLYKERAGKAILASPVVVRGKPIFVKEDGEALVLEPGRDFKVAGRNRLSDGTEFRASPAIVDGRLYLRSQSYLYCIGEKK